MADPPFQFRCPGRPVVYLSLRRDGVHKSYSPGIDCVTGRPKYQATVDRVLWLSELARQPVREVDPAVEPNWFDANSGEPNLWYVETGPNEWHFFNRPHFHQQLRLEVLPITPEVMARWKAEHARRMAVTDALRREREAAAKAAAAAKALRERERAEQERRQERERAEQRRQTDFWLKAEAAGRAKLEAERQEREERRRRIPAAVPVSNAVEFRSAPQAPARPPVQWAPPWRRLTLTRRRCRPLVGGGTSVLVRQ